MVNGGVAPARVDLRLVPEQPGIVELLVPVGGQGQRTLELSMPEKTPRSVVILLHGTVANPGAGPGARAQTRTLLECLAAPALGALDPIIIAPRSSTGQWWLKEDTELVLGLVQAAKARWPATRGRAVVAGYSNGGIGAWYFARLYAPFFAAAIPMAFNDTIVGPSPLPLYAIQGSRDEQFPIERVRAAVESLKAQGQDITFDEKYRGSHMQPCSYVDELTAAGHWLETHAFSKRGGAEATSPAP
jgi:predicted esterase